MMIFFKNDENNKWRSFMKIVCFGDSNTWGYSPQGSRFDKNIRWPTVMAAGLGDDYTIIEEGLCGRTSDNPDFFVKCIKKYYPFDMMVIMLGTNDLRPEFKFSANDIAENIGKLVELVLKYDYNGGDVPKVIMVSPPYVKPGVSTSKNAYMFGLKEDCVERSKELIVPYKKKADELGVYFLDAATYAEVSEIDSLHLDEEGHMDLANGIGKFIYSIYNDKNNNEDNG